MTKCLTKYFSAVVVLLFAVLVAPKANADSTIQTADSAYNAGNYRQALTLYNSVMDDKGSSSALFYNIGNTHYRIGNVGQAVLAYERALQLDPSNDDARANLDFVNSTIKGLPEDGSTFLSNIHSSVCSFTSPDGWAVIALVLFVVVLGCVALYMFASGVMIRKIGFFGGLVVLAVFIYALVIAWQTGHAVDNHDRAIVISQNAKLRTNPGVAKNKDEKTVTIPEGASVQIVDSIDTPADPVAPMYYNVRLTGNTEAWIASSDVERI